MAVHDNFYSKMKHLNTLFEIIKKNKEEQFLDYIDNLTTDEIDVNIKDDSGNYLIYFAIIMNSRRIVKKLIEYNSRLDIIDTDGYTILYYPIKFNYNDMIETLLEYDKKILGISLINLKDSRGATPLFYSIKFHNNYALQQLLTFGADASYKNKEYMSVLHLAVLKKDIVTVKIILKYTKAINSQTKDGSTPLHYAVNFQQAEISKLLLDNGAKHDIFEYEYDFYPIFFSVIQNDITITKILLDYTYNVNHQDYLGNTILHYCIANSHDELIDMIFHRFKIDKKKIKYYSENINSIAGDSAYIDPKISNIDGLTIGHIMLYKYKESYDKYMEKILPYSDLNHQDNSGNTILHLLVIKNQWEKYENILQNKKLNLYIRNNDGDTILELVEPKNVAKMIDIVAQSYYNHLHKHPDLWKLKWQTTCSVNLNVEDPTHKQYCIDHIKSEIISEKKSYPVSKIKVDIPLMTEEHIEFTTFTGSLLDMLVGFKYLTKKYQDVTSVITHGIIHNYDETYRFQTNPHQQLIDIDIRWEYLQLFLPDKFESIMINTIKKSDFKYIVIPIGIILSEGHHSNALYIDIKNQTIERIEPHGSQAPYKFNYNPELLDDVLYKTMSNIFNKIFKKSNIIYYRPKDYLPRIGFQTLETTELSFNKNIGDPNGFCTLWSIWYLDYRIKYHDKPPQYIIKRLINQIRANRHSFRSIIRNYSKKITKLRDDYLSLIGRNINNYLNNQLSITELNTLSEIIVNDNKTI